MRRSNLAYRCQSYLCSDADGGVYGLAVGHFAGRVGYPDEGSQFALALGPLRYAFRLPGVGSVLASGALAYLRGRGYDALGLVGDGGVVGSAAFQEHADRSWHVFSVYVPSEYRGQGLAGRMVDDLVGKARGKDIVRVRIGGGKSEATNALHRKLEPREEELGVLVEAENWVRILRQ